MFRGTCGDYSCATKSLTRETAGALGTRRSLRPLFFWADELHSSGASRRVKAKSCPNATPVGNRPRLRKGGFDARAALFWAFVGVPLAWGVWKTLSGAIKII
jgi:hypothetical protein